jgi:hypothetical protein
VCVCGVSVLLLCVPMCVCMNFEDVFRYHYNDSTVTKTGVSLSVFF